MTDRPATDGDPPFESLPAAATSRLLLLCDHASNRLPAALGTLGLPPFDLERHIAYDIGAAPLTRALADRLKAAAILTSFSRLLIDPNRGLDDPTLIMRLSDGSVVPGNARCDAVERARRIARYYEPYHAEIDRVIDRSLAEGRVPIIVSIHSFTPAWKGMARPWHAGILWDTDRRLAGRLIKALSADPSLVVGDNEPYSGLLKNDTLNRHATQRGLPHVLIEIRQDLIGDPSGVRAWADRLAPILAEFGSDPALAVALPPGP